MSSTNGIASANTQVLQSLLGQSDRVGSASKDVSAKAATSTRRSDSAEFSSAASSLSQVSATTDDVRADKVAAIQSAIAAGTYSVPAGAVADKLIQHLLG